MSKCPLSYSEVEGRYDMAALHRLHPKLQDLKELPFTSDELRWEAGGRAHKLSIQGVQPKLSARLNLKNQCFDLVDQKGQFILKPQNGQYPALPENEDLTMKLARLSGLEVPDHGLIPGHDGVLTYWIRRFDRRGRSEKVPMEDFAQLLGRTRDTKYDSSLEEVASVIQERCSFPLVEWAKLFRLVLFNFLCGNDDQHLKNFSLIENAGRVRLSPCYDLVNSTIITRTTEETALSLRDKKKALSKEDLVEYFGREILTLQPLLIENTLRDLAVSLAQWSSWIQRSFLWPKHKKLYLALMHSRSQRLGFAWIEVAKNELKALGKFSLQKGAGGHQNFFKQLDSQREGLTYCLTEQQLQTIPERQTAAGGWQTAYRILASKSVNLIF